MGNVTLAEWSEFDFDQKPAVWVIPRKKMKAHDRPHDHKIIRKRSVTPHPFVLS
jgi:hypothetical protein